jgi:hypothetical protein
LITLLAFLGVVAVLFSFETCMKFMKFFTGLALALASVTVIFFAHQPVHAAVADETIIAQSVGLLPTNPFYFFKEFGRNIRRIFTFRQINKVDLELFIADEKLAEIAKLEILMPDNVEALGTAVFDYRETVRRVSRRLGSLSGSGVDPDVGALVNRVLAFSFDNHEFLEQFALRHSDLDDVVLEAQTSLDALIRVIPDRFDTPEAFGERLTNVLLPRIVSDGFVSDITTIERLALQSSSGTLRETLFYVASLLSGMRAISTPAGTAVPEAFSPIAE